MFSGSPYLILAAAYAGVNLLTFFAFGWDKHCARTDRRRVAEATLLRMAFFGGSAGAKIAQRHFRHKTYKQPFGRQLNLILFLQIVLVPPLLIPQTHAAIAEFLRTW